MHNAKRLPDAYRKNTNSNNYKMLDLVVHAVDALKSDMTDVNNCLNINLATGKTLDLYGVMLDQRRGLLNDVQYRYMLYTRIGRNTVKGDYQSIMNVIVQMFNCNQGDITLDDFELEEMEKPCTVKLTRFPLFVLAEAGFSSRQAVQMIESLFPICVTLDAQNFDGTFEFAELSNEYNEETGFGNVEQTMGGYLGLLLGEDDLIPVLPV